LSHGLFSLLSNPNQIDFCFEKKQCLGSVS
jgi:hypothetical protein